MVWDFFHQQSFNLCFQQSKPGLCPNLCFSDACHTSLLLNMTPFFLQKWCKFARSTYRKCHPGFSMGPSLSKHSSWISQFQPLSLKNDEGQKKPQVIDARSVSWARAAGISWIHEVFSCWDILIVYSFWWKLPTLGSKKSPTGSIDPWFWFPQKARSQFTLHGVRW